MKTHSVTGGGGLELHVVETGDPSGKPILFIHGTSQSHLAWERQLESGLGRRFRLVGMDLRGHGGSEKPRDVYGDSKLWADDVRAVITTLGLESPVLSGWSYGGIVMSDYIHRYGEDDIAGTHWVGAVSRLGEPLLEAGFLTPGFLEIVPGLFSEDVGESIATLQAFVRLAVFQELAPEQSYRFLGWNVVVPPHVRLGLFSRELDHDAVVEGLRKPALVTHGREDAIVHVAASEHLAGLTSLARLSVHPDAGHAVFWDAPESFNAELAEFRADV